MFTFRKTSLGESDKLKQWYKAPAVHRWVPIEDWFAYFQAVSGLEDYYLYSVYDLEQMIAIVASEVSDNKAALCLVVDPKLHGMGIGSSVLQDMQHKTQELFGSIIEYRAGIFPGNIGSIKCFEKAGFKRTGNGQDGELIFSYMITEE